MRKAFDLLLQGETGVIATTGTGDDLAKVGISVGDIGAGVYGAMAVLAALYERERTGKGRHVQSSLFDALSEWMGYPALLHDARRRHPRPGQASAMRRSCRTAPTGAGMEGRSCSRSRLRPNGTRSAGTSAAIRNGSTIRASTPSQTAAPPGCARICDRRRALHIHPAEVTGRLEAADIPYGDLNSIEQFSRTSAAGRARPLAGDRNARRTDAGAAAAVRNSGRRPLDGRRPRGRRAHRAVLAELGYDAGAIEQLRGSGAIYTGACPGMSPENGLSSGCVG